MLFLIIVFGLIGLAVGGPVGLLVGGGLGWWLGRRIGRRLSAARMQLQEGFLESIFSVMGCLCQADGKVTDGELSVAEKLFDKCTCRVNTAPKPAPPLSEAAPMTLI